MDLLIIQLAKSGSHFDTGRQLGYVNWLGCNKAISVYLNNIFNERFYCPAQLIFAMGQDQWLNSRKIAVEIVIRINTFDQVLFHKNSSYHRVSFSVTIINE